jgi:hypothetical protein
MANKTAVRPTAWCAPRSASPCCTSTTARALTLMSWTSTRQQSRRVTSRVVRLLLMRTGPPLIRLLVFVTALWSGTFARAETNRRDQREKPRLLATLRALESGPSGPTPHH